MDFPKTFTAPLWRSDFMTDDTLEQAGKAAYDAYCATRDWKSFRGEPLPQWGDSPEDIRHGWREAARAVLEQRS